MSEEAKPHVIYLLLTDGRPSAWAHTREDATKLAERLTLADLERNKQRQLKGGYAFAPSNYSTTGLTDSPYGDPEVDTSEKAVESRILTLTKAFKEADNTLGAVMHDLGKLRGLSVEELDSWSPVKINKALRDLATLRSILRR